ncbi:glycosyltransferase family 2 protein [Paraburkholderia metrosideri]|uniref:Glycosyltransferase 2-like domain-containing protein n=1 Tax=Paraburkholderia metrosideri TaxID=580937 RepID=A0ABN7HVJ3_9BURK|nr:glycosyltransferase [Paraburkholderia metrosideri]CAD6540161.1 hypothetical protein LMG28140_03466 [Paraburkholderia metrosideri]
MTTVSILVPAYKPEYLQKAIISAQTQSFRDIEILVGDDNADGRLRDVVACFDDSRIRYFHHGFQDGLQNSRRLWERCTGKYVKWLYDDDILMPSSVQTLLDALVSNPDALMAFHERVFIDGNDKVVHVPSPLIPAGQGARIDRDFLVQNMVVDANNFIGEPSNVMLARDKVDISTVMRYRSWGVKFLNDVAMYLNLAERAPLVLAGGYHSCFRKHEAQNSSGASPMIAAGYYEWEVMIRGEAAAGRFPGAAFARAKERLKEIYTHGVEIRGIRELQILSSNLDEITESPAGGLFDSPRFLDGIANVQKMIAARTNA